MAYWRNGSMEFSLRHYAITPLHHYAITPLRHYAITPLRFYAITPLRHYAITALRLYDSVYDIGMTVHIWRNGAMGDGPFVLTF